MPLPLPKSPKDIEEIHRQRLPLAVEQAKKAPFFKDRLAGIDISKLDDPSEWAKIPILEKEDLRALSAETFMTDFNLAPRGEIMEYWRSGGATGKPLFYPRTFEDMKYMFLAFRRGIACAGVKKRDSVHISFPLGIHPVGHLYARVCQQAGVGVNWAGSGASTPSAVQVQLIHDLKPTVWMGMSSYGLHLANHAESMGIDLASSSVEKVICSAEPLSKAKREKLERSWGAEVYDLFGMTEACLMGGEDAAHDGFRIWTDMFYVEILDPETWEPVGVGKTGTFVVTPLWTFNSTPFIRWNSGDIVSHYPGGAGNGPFSVFPIVKHAHRTSGFFKVRGVNINHSEFEDFLFGYEQVQDFKAEIVTVRDLDRLRVSLEYRRDSDESGLNTQIETAIKQTFEVSPEIVVLKRGTLAAEFETAVKAPRFQDNRD